MTLWSAATVVGTWRSDVKPLSGFEIAALGVKLWIDPIAAY